MLWKGKEDWFKLEGIELPCILSIYKGWGERKREIQHDDMFSTLFYYPKEKLVVFNVKYYGISKMQRENHELEDTLHHFYHSKYKTCATPTNATTTTTKAYYILIWLS